MQKRLGDLALTNALLLSFSFSMMLEVPHVLEDMDASDWQLKYYFFALFWGNVCLLVSLLLCMFFTVQIGNAPRHSDKLLVIMRQATAYLGGGMYVPAHDVVIRFYLDSCLPASTTTAIPPTNSIKIEKLKEQWNTKNNRS